MSVDNFEIDFHLTPNGWIQGTRRFYGNPQGDIVPRPQDAVETWTYKIYQRSEWSGEERSKWCEWESNDVPKEERDQLRKKYPFPMDD